MLLRALFSDMDGSSQLSLGPPNGTVAAAADYAVTVSAGETWDDILSADFKDMVPKHWLKFKPPLPQVQYILGTMYMIMMTAGLLANGCIIWLVVTTKQLRTPSNYLVVNLAISDFLILAKAPVFIYNSFALGPLAGQRWCEFYGALGGLSGTSAIMTIAAMAVERYISISKPLHPSSRMTRGRAGIMVLAIWIYALIFSMAPLLGLNRYVPEGYLTSCSFNYLSDDMKDKVFIFCFFFAAWCVPLTIVCFSYFGMLISVRRAQSVFLRHAQKMDSSNRNLQKHRKTEIQLAKISFCLISLWTLSWTPYATVALLGIFTDRSMITPLSSMVPALFCKTASVLDPIVYGLSNRKFKIELYKRIKRTVRLKKVKRNISQTHVFRTIFRDSVASEPSEQQGYLTPEFKKDFCQDYSSDEDSSQDKCYSVPLCSSQRSRTRQDTLASTTAVLLPKPKSSGRSDNETKVQVETVKIFFIPRMYTVKMENDELKISFRRSL